MRLRVPFLGLVLLLVSTVTYSQTLTPPQPTDTVYVTKTGSKYHRAGCRSLSKSQISMKLADAAARYSPCSICKPQVLTAVEASRQFTASANGTPERGGTKTESGSKQVKPAPAQLTIEVGVVMKSGDVKRVARTEFLLLDADFGAMLVERVTFSPSAGQSQFSAASNALATLRTMLENPASFAPLGDKAHEDARRTVAAVDVFLKQHTVAKATTNFEGNAKFPDLPAGPYYLLGSAKIFDTDILWYVPTRLQAGANQVVRDNQNAAK